MAVVRRHQARPGSFMGRLDRWAAPPAGVETGGPAMPPPLKAHQSLRTPENGVVKDGRDSPESHAVLLGLTILYWKVEVKQTAERRLATACSHFQVL